jgi:hypothetical protein
LAPAAGDAVGDVCVLVCAAANCALARITPAMTDHLMCVSSLLTREGCKHSAAARGRSFG